jgi:hypothetical protein
MPRDAKEANAFTRLVDLLSNPFLVGLTAHVVVTDVDDGNG